jgi:hypothetical protein
VSTRTTDLRPEDALESGIRESAMANVAKLRHVPENEGEVVAANLDTMVQQVSGAPLLEIDRLMSDLQSLREHIEGEGERVQRTLAEVAYLSRSSVQSTTVMSEALDQLKKAAHLPSRS